MEFLRTNIVVLLLVLCKLSRGQHSISGAGRRVFDSVEHEYCKAHPHVMECKDMHAVITSLAGRKSILKQAEDLMRLFAVEYTVYIHGELDSSNFLGPNKGDESHGFVKFIIDHYENLPKTVLFIHDDIYHHNSRIKEWMACLNLYPELPYTNLALDAWLEREIFPQLNASAHKMFNNTVIADINQVHLLGFYCCANFIVGRDAILAHPISFYRDILEDMFKEQKNEGRVVGQLNYGSFLEHSWHAIFGMPWYLLPLNDSTACWHYDCEKQQCLYSLLDPSSKDIKIHEPLFNHLGLPRNWLGYVWERADANIPRHMKQLGQGGNESKFCTANWPSISFFMPFSIHDTNGHNRLWELKAGFFASLLLFWPLKIAKTALLITYDEENGSHASITELKKIANAAKPFMYNSDILRVEGIAPSNAYESGYDRQQLNMFYADLHVSPDVDYIALIDSDASFITQVSREDIFEDDKPIVIGRYGYAKHPVIQKWSRATYMALGLLEPFKCMSYFPVVIKRQHFLEIREFIAKYSNSTFDEAFKRNLVEGSQFGIMCAYLYTHRRSEYVWYVQSETPTWDGKVPPPVFGQDGNVSQFTPDMKIPKPRIATHLGHRLASVKQFGPHGEKLANYKTFLQRGLCHSPPFPRKESECWGVDPKVHYFEMHHFDYVDYREAFTTQQLDAEAMKRYERICNCPAVLNYLEIAHVFSTFVNNSASIFFSTPPSQVKAPTLEAPQAVSVNSIIRSNSSGSLSLDSTVLLQMVGVLPIIIKVGVCIVEQRDKSSFWIEFDPTNDMILSEERLLLPLIAIDETDDEYVPFYVQYPVRACSSIFQSNLPNPQFRDKALFRNAMESQCQLIQKENPTMPVMFLDKPSSIEETMTGLDATFLCYHGPSSTFEKKNFRAIAMTKVLDALGTHTIHLLDIDAQGADVGILLSLRKYVHNIEHIKLECQESPILGFLYESRVPNECALAKDFLLEMGFRIDKQEMNNCGISEFNIFASRADLK